jgi:uncharacterized glyoxalase superfamily protein PhnB
MTITDTKLWTSMSFRDAEAMMRYLAAIGFTDHATYRDDTDPSRVVHAEWVWAAGGGIMFGTATPDGLLQNAGRAAVYLVCDDPDDLVDRALAAGATVDRAVADNDYGGRGGSVRDPEGNHWAFGSYQPS